MEQEILKVYKINKDKKCVSLKKIFNSIQEVYNDYCEKENSIINKFSGLSYFRDYFLDHYDYKERELVIGDKNPNNSHEYFHYFQKKENDLYAHFDYRDKKAEFLYILYSVELNDAIKDYERFRNFKTINPKKISCINSNLLLNIGDSSMDLLSLNKDNKEYAHITLNYDDSMNIDACSKNIIFYFDKNQNALLNTIQVNINDLPDWCKQAILSYDEKHSNIFNKMFSKFNEVISVKNINVTESNILDKDLKDISDSIEDMVSKYSILSQAKENYERVKISADLLFKEVDDHLEINEKYINNLKYIDLRMISFKNVLVSGIDFTDTNIDINPQLVYNKDLSYCTFADKDKKYNPIPFNIYTDFNGVNLCGTVILGDSDFRYNLDGAITDENTKIIYNYSIEKAIYKK